jgi:SAM-dependent methyltransferase
MDRPTPDADVLAHYAVTPEDGRITDGLGQLELLRTQEIVRRHLDPAPLDVLDVGGATGVHAAWLVDDGHRVHVVDLAPDHVATARTLPQARGGGLTAAVGDARALEHPDASVDVVLLLGPLYHLVAATDRQQALREARRVLRPGGLIVVAAVSRFASLFDGLARGFLFDPAFRAIVDADLATGVHRNPDDVPGWWTTAYFHRPEELVAEVVAAGFDLVEVVGVEGVAPWIRGLEVDWADADRRAQVVAAARAVEHEPSVLGVSPHVLAVARRPGA